MGGWACSVVVSVSLYHSGGRGRPQHKLSSTFVFLFPNSHHELHSPRHCEEDKRGQGEGQDGEDGPDGVGAGMTKYVFRPRNWRRVLSRQCWGAWPGTVLPATPSPSTPQPTRQTTGGGGGISGDRSPLKMFLSGEYH